tara:strand:- start:7506 stop:7937 length:432 start_codon:yes stop_codon:yes gene_type:complete
LIELILQLIDNSHFLFIHFAIALFPCSFFLDLISILLKNKSAEIGSWWCLLLGAFGSIFSILTGFMADSIYGHMSLPFPIFSTHGFVQIIASFMFWVLLLWRLKNKNDLPKGKFRKYYIVFEALAVAIFIYGGHLGAILSGRI